MARLKEDGRSYGWKMGKQDSLEVLNSSEETQEIARSHREPLSILEVWP